MWRGAGDTREEILGLVGASEEEGRDAARNGALPRMHDGAVQQGVPAQGKSKATWARALDLQQGNFSFLLLQFPLHAQEKMGDFLQGNYKGKRSLANLANTRFNTIFTPINNLENCLHSTDKLTD